MRQTLFGRWAGNASKAATGFLAVSAYGVLGSSARYAPASGSGSFLDWPISASGRFERFRLALLASPTECGVQLFTFRLDKNGVSTGVEIVIEDDAVTGTSPESVTVAVGDVLRWEMEPFPVFPVITEMDIPEVIQSCDFVSNETGVSIYFSRGVAIQPSSGSPGYNGVFNPTDDWVDDPDAARNVISVNGTITRYDILMQMSPVDAGGTSFTYVLVLDGIEQDGSGGTVDTRLTLTSSESGTWTGALPVSNTLNQHIVFKSTSVGFPSGGSTRTSLCVKFAATTDGEFWLGGYNGVPPSNVVVEYQVPTANDINHQWETSDARKYLLGGATPVRLSGLRVWIAETPGAGASRTFDVHGGPTVTISDEENIQAGTGAFIITPGNEWVLRHTPSGSPDAVDNGVAWAFVGSSAGKIGPLVWVEWPRLVP